MLIALALLRHSVSCLRNGHYILQKFGFVISQRAREIPSLRMTHGGAVGVSQWNIDPQTRNQSVCEAGENFGFAEIFALW